MSEFRELYITLARWCNQPGFFKKMSFKEFCLRNQEVKKNQTENGSSMKALLDFEEKQPVIATAYFDLKYSEISTRGEIE